MSDQTMADDPDAAGNYWTVSTTAMTQLEAQSTAAWIEATFPDVDAEPVDPKECFTMIMDPATVRIIRDGLALASADGRDIGSLLEECENWLNSVASPEE